MAAIFLQLAVGFLKCTEWDLVAIVGKQLVSVGEGKGTNEDMVV